MIERLIIVIEHGRVRRVFTTGQQVMIEVANLDDASRTDDPECTEHIKDLMWDTESMTEVENVV